MHLFQNVDRIDNKDDLAAFIVALRRELKDNPAAYENVTLDDFLEAMSAWVTSLDGFLKNRAREIGDFNPFQFVATVLSAAAIYE